MIDDTSSLIPMPPLSEITDSDRGLPVRTEKSPTGSTGPRVVDRLLVTTVASDDEGSREAKERQESQSIAKVRLITVVDSLLMALVLMAPLSGLETIKNSISADGFKTTSIVRETSRYRVVWQALTGCTILVAAASVCLHLATPRDPDGDEPSLTHRYLYAALMIWWGVQALRMIAAEPSSVARLQFWVIPAVYTAAYSQRLSYERIYSIFEWFVRLSTAGVVALMLIAPTLVTEPGYRGILPFMPFRLHGFYAVGYHMAFLVAAFWLLPIPDHLRGFRPIRLMSGGCNVAVFVLTQGKAVYLFFFICWGIKRLANYYLATGRRPLTSMLPWLLTLGALTGLLMIPEVIRGVADLTDIPLEELLSMTGRTDIWHVMIDDSRDSWVFGKSPSSWEDVGWSLRFRRNLVIPHAHNQFVQMLWECGIVGCAALTLYIAVFFWRLSALAARLLPGVLAVAVLLWMRTATEVFFGILSAGTVLMTVHFVLFMIMSLPATPEDSSSHDLA